MIEIPCLILSLVSSLVCSATASAASFAAAVAAASAETNALAFLFAHSASSANSISLSAANLRDNASRFARAAARNALVDAF